MFDEVEENAVTHEKQWIFNNYMLSMIDGEAFIGDTHDFIEILESANNTIYSPVIISWISL